jgi:uncharacterized RDD family membrane protein YckC
MLPEQTTEPGYSVFDEMEQYKPVNYASTGARFANYLIDIAVFYGLLFLSGMLLGLLQSITGIGFIDFLVEQEESAFNKLLTYLYVIVIFTLAYSIIEGASKGRTLGKLITGTKAVREDGSSITWKDALLRSLARLVPFEVVSGLGGHPWHDKWTKTIVIKTRGAGTEQ